MSATTAVILVVGGVCVLALDHYLRARRARPAEAQTDHEPESPEDEESRMSLSENQVRGHALAYVRRQILRGRYTETDMAKWSEELGPVVYEIEIELRPEAPKLKPRRKPKAEAPDPEPEAAPLEEIYDGTS